MPNPIMSQIQVSGMDYDICDLEGRLKLKDLENAISTNQKILGEQGTAYAIYDSNTNTLTFFRANETYTSSDTSATDIMGNTYTGTIYTGIEDYTTAPAPWDDVKANIEKVVIADNQYIIPKSCAGWFSDTSVEEFENISQLDFRRTTDLSYMFAGCTELETLPDLSEWDTSNVTNMAHMFDGCGATNFKSISTWDTSNVTNMSGMFNSSNLHLDTESYVFNWDTSSVTDFSNMFANYEGTSLYKMSGWDTSAAQNMAGMFQNCPNVTLISLGQNWDTSNVTNMDNMFENCPELVKDCSSWNVSKVTSHIDFAEDSPDVIEPNWPVKSAPLVNGRAFRTALANLVGEEIYEEEESGDWRVDDYSVSTQLIKIEQKQSNDTSGTLVSVPNGSDPDVYLKFNNETGTATIVSSANVIVLPQDCSGMFKDCSRLTSFPDCSYWDSSNVVNMESMFLAMGYFNAIWDPGTTPTFLDPPKVDSWDTSNVTSLKSTFAYCGFETPPNVSKWNTEKVTTLEETFMNLYSTTPPPVQNWDTKNVTSCKNTFYYMPFCQFFPDVANWNVSNVKTFEGMFSTIMNLYTWGEEWTNPVFSNWDTTNAENFSEMFFGLGLEEIIGLENWNTSNIKKMNSMFSGCSNLVLDCSGWDVRNVTDHEDFAFSAPGVIEPNWLHTEGTAYAILDSAGTLTFFRSTNNYTAGTGQTVTDIKGNSYTGQVYTDIETYEGASSTSAPWYSQRSSILLAKIADNQTIAPISCAGWFNGCYRMTDFEGADRLDTSNVTDMSFMFSDCRSATFNPNVSDWNTSNVTNMGAIFSSCTGAAFNPDVSNWDTSNVTSMGGIFSGCSGAAFNPDVSNWNISNVTNMGNMFGGCNGALFNPDVSNWNTSNVTNMFGVFQNCNGAIFNPDVSDWDTSKVTNMSNMFYSCRGAAFNPNVSNWNTSNVTNMNSMFYYCSGEAFNPDLSNWDTSKVTDMSNMFSRCSGVAFTSLDVSNWNISNVTNMTNMFSNGSNLTTIYAAPDANWGASTKLTSSSGMFSGCTKLKGGNNTTYNSSYTNKTYARVDKTDQPGYFTAEPSAYAVLDSAGTLTFFRSENAYTAGTGQTVTDVDGNSYTGQVYTGIETYNGGEEEEIPWEGNFEDIIKVTIADNQIIAPINCAWWFASCSNMTNFEGANRLNTSRVTSMAGMFEGCSNAAFNPDLSSWNTSNVTDMSFMFNGCSGATFNPDLSNWNTSSVINMQGMFNGCSGEAFNPDLSSWNISNVTNMSYMFGGCSNLTTIYMVPDTNWGASTKLASSENMFYNCTKLKGGNNTAYNSSYTDKTYARVDKDGQPGYFTAKNDINATNVFADRNIIAAGTITSGGDITAGGEFKVDAPFDSNASSLPATVYRDLVKSFDNQDIQYAAVSSWKEADGDDGLNLVLHRVINGVDYFNRLGVLMKNDGTRRYFISDPGAFAMAAQPDITLTTSQWVKGSRAYGQYFSVDIPCIAQPQSVTCTNSAMYVHSSGSWQSITFRDWVWFGNMLYVRFNEISAMTEGMMFLVRMDLTVSFEHM